ncbi:HAD-IA family hydrolase [Iodobacter fluviatilis]|uniref:Phosphoglycolate phosphatase n=1 Tax=Iodobacter fluviatilis TaxID=537 RepID=A0A377Q753_9NEIS|nr:HAD-IA family hydrolase [Iodobacter fluviatilis]TCU89191.1 phosphoglycolate phosphatase [Iodobacter fluviatilis]STQ90560.1 Pyrophosphatase ppaX [Iodobacter fluviatilis]
MPKQFDLLVFDWDGTLMDSTGTIARAIQSAFAEVGLPVPSDKEARYVIGYGMHEAMQHLAPEASAAQITEVVGAYRRFYLAQDQDVALYDGVLDALPLFADAGFQMAVATGKSRAGLDRVLASTGLDAFFKVTRTADEAFSKPHPAMLHYILDKCAVEGSRAVMIGDTTHDLQLAQNAGTQSLALTYGAHKLPELLTCKPLAHFDDFHALKDWILLNA